MQRILGGVLVVALTVPAATGCAVRRHNLIARDAAYVESGKRLRNVRVLLRDGSVHLLRRVEIVDDTLRGTTVDGVELSLPASDVERAWQVEKHAGSTLSGLVTVLAVCGVTAIVVGLTMSPLEF